MSRPRHREDLPFLLAQVHREIHAGLSRILDADNLPVEQWRVLNALADGQGQTVSALAGRVSMNMSALSKNLDRMVSRALVHRRQDTEDHRRVLVYVTDFGLELLKRHAAKVERYHADLEDALGSNGAVKLSRMLRTILSHREQN